MAKIIPFPDQPSIETALEDLAFFQERERVRFQQEFPPLPPSPLLPSISWAQAKRQLEELAPTSTTKSLVSPLLHQLESESGWRSPESVFQQIAIICALVLEAPSPSSGEAAMT